MFAFLSGLLAGCLHVLSGPDHLAAVLPLAARAPAGARSIGAAWGLGHGGGVLAWLAFAWLFRHVVPVDVISGTAELFVGCSLIAVGLWALWRRSHEHGTSDRRHEHGAALGMGVLHGTAGAGHLFGVLPLLGLSAQGSIAYAAGYVVAGVGAMAGFGVVMGLMSERVGDARRLRGACALLTLCVGCGWLLNVLWV